MPAFRILTLEELELLKPEFVQFLSANGISGQDWDKWRIDNPDKREEWVGRFSEFVFFSIIQKTKYWQKRLETGIQMVQILEDTFLMLWFKNISPRVENEEGFVNQNIEVYTRIKKIEDTHKDQELQDLFNQGFVPVKANQNKELDTLFHTYFSVSNSKPTQNSI